MQPTDTASPLYVASTAFDPREGFPRRIADRLAARGDGWLPISMSADTYSAGLERAHEIIDDAGRDPADFEAAYYQDVVIAETEAEAIDQARDFLYPSWGELSDDEIRNRGAFGPPSVVAEHLERYADAGVETFVTRFATTDQREQLRRFTDIVS